jgi:hypothetical protein
MVRCRKRISSPNLEGWTFEDECEGRVFFFLQNRHPFTGIGHEWTTSDKMCIKAQWAERADAVEHLVLPPVQK